MLYKLFQSVKKMIHSLFEVNILIPKCDKRTSRKEKIQANFTYKYICKNSKQNTSNLKPALYIKDKTL